MAKKKTPEQFMQECKNKGYDLPVEKYINTRTKIKYKCSNCGNVYVQSPANHLKGSGCSVCAIRKVATKHMKTNECKKERVDLPIDKYSGVNNKLCFKCQRGHFYKQRAIDHFKSGCPHCPHYKGKNSVEYRFNEYKKKCTNIGVAYPLFGYVNNKTPMYHECVKRGHIFKCSPQYFKTRRECPRCNHNSLYNDNFLYNEKCKQLNYDLPIDILQGPRTKIRFKCSSEHIYKQTPYSHIVKGTSCPYCKQSRGEKYIQCYLKNNEIKYVAQKKFSNLKDKSYLSYDFYLPEYNMLIEYQGEQHYRKNKYFGGTKVFQKQQLHDKLKKEYAKNNGYKLLCLPYLLNTQEKVNIYLEQMLK